MVFPTYQRNKFSVLVNSLFILLVGALFTPITQAQQTVISNESGTHDGYFYSFWSDGDGGSITMELGPQGNFSAEWSDVNNFFVGKGWETGGRRTVNYTVNSFEPGGNSWVGILGFTLDPYKEYYIVDNWGAWRPNAGAVLGTVTTDGGTYDIYKRFVARPDLYYDVYWSVRQEKRPEGGTITTGNHFDAWAALGMGLENFHDMVVMVEGYQSTGSADITVGELPTSSCEVCNWYGWHLPVCQSQDYGWGWENYQNCVGLITCGFQWGGGGPICN